MEATINLTIQDRLTILTIDEAKELLATLESLVGDKMTYIPPTVYPYPCPSLPWWYTQPTYTYTTSETGGLTNIKNEIPTMGGINNDD